MAGSSGGREVALRGCVVWAGRGLLSNKVEAVPAVPAVPGTRACPIVVIHSQRVIRHGRRARAMAICLGRACDGNVRWRWEQRSEAMSMERGSCGQPVGRRAGAGRWAGREGTRRACKSSRDREGDPGSPLSGRSSPGPGGAQPHAHAQGCGCCC